MRFSMNNLISSVAALALATMATQANATTVTFTTSSDKGFPGGNINYWYFSGSGGLSYADGLADGTYTDKSVLSSFNEAVSFFLNVNTGVPSPPTFTFAGATWDFDLSDITNFSLFIDQGIPKEATFTLGPKLPTTFTQGFALSQLTYSFDSYNDPNPTATFSISNGDQGLRLTGDLNATIAAVPEPATWALMLVGFGAIGVAMRRRPQVSVSYA